MRGFGDKEKPIPFVSRLPAITPTTKPPATRNNEINENYCTHRKLICLCFSEHFPQLKTSFLLFQFVYLCFVIFGTMFFNYFQRALMFVLRGVWRGNFLVESSFPRLKFSGARGHEDFNVLCETLKRI